MRTLILVLIVLVVALIVAVQSNLIDIRQTQGAEVPRISANESGVTASGGKPPAFEVETGKVAIGTEAKNVTVPVPVPAVRVQPADSGNTTVNAN